MSVRMKKHETLGENVTPKAYELHIEPDLNTFEYNGRVKISVSIKDSTKKITLNSAELELKSATVVAGGYGQNAKIKADKKKERITLEIMKAVSGDADIRIDFTGKNNDRLYGFYRSKYVQDGKEMYILTTQFEATSARKAFPCFDEPSLKARFRLEMLVDKDLYCISNMPVKEEKMEVDRKLVIFGETPVMSTYLLYMGVGRFEKVEEKAEGVSIRIFTVPGKSKYSKLALGYAKRMLRHYNRYFGIKYPLPKMDLLAIPDFAAGAMENWGAITFREAELLGDAKTAIRTKQRIAEVIAHEMAHQWFGDLVTMKWWNDLWLNESFATFMSYKALDALFPEWKMKEQRLLEVMAPALSADQLENTHPISVEISTPAEIDQVFDEISYEKGGAVLNMLESYAGKEAFRNGLKSYLKKHSYSNAEKEDLWCEIDSATGGRKRVADLASCWINKKGYPAVRVEDSRGTMLMQKRFMLSGKKESGIWMIPLSYVSSANRKGSELLMTGKVHRISRKFDWIKLNYGQSVPCRIIYNERLIDALADEIKSGNISPSDAWGVENDLYAVARSSEIEVGKYLDFVDRCCFAAKYPLNLSALSHLRSLNGMLHMAATGELKERVLHTTVSYANEIIKQVGWAKSKEESSITTMMRSAAVSAAGIAGDKQALRKAEKLFSVAMEGGNVDPDIKGAVYSLAAWNGNAETFSALKARYVKEELPEEKRRLLGAMGMFKDKSLLGRSLDFSMSKEVRYQDAFVIPAIVSSNPVGRSIIWKWTKRNWKQISKMFGVGTHMLGRYVDNIAAVSNKKEFEEVKSFFRSMKVREDITLSVKQAIEIIGINIKFLERNEVI